MSIALRPLTSSPHALHDLVGKPTHDGHGEDADEPDDAVDVDGFPEGEAHVLGPVADHLRPDQELSHHTGEEHEDRGPDGILREGLLDGPYLLVGDSDLLK